MAVRKVGTCRIVRELGRGGMGVVFEAFQEALDRRVAVKALDSSLARTREAAERFRREGRAYAQLRHQAVVAVHDLVDKDDTLYLVTDFVDGADLNRILTQGGPLPPACIAVIGARIAEALDYIHFRKLLHRDVKPANIMVSREGEVKLMDFGIAKDQTASDLTRVGMLVGSPSYLAPEVLTSEPAGPQSDIWALGITLYELACGQKPFTGTDAEVLFASIRRGRFPHIRSLVPGFPRRLAKAIERCLQPRPGARWKNAGELARALQNCTSSLLGTMHHQARLMALLAHRGFAPEEEALTRMDAASLMATRKADEGTSTASAPAKPLPRWRLAVLAVLALTVGMVVWLARL